MLAEALLRGCPRLQILATSREGLGIAGEQRYRVPPLSQSEAIQLFVERARLQQPDFTITERNAPALETICVRLDGIPLAIELAAARVRSLAPDQIAARLDDRLRLLVGGSRTALPRQQTLRAAIDWSYDLLSPQEQTLLQTLSLFRGGWCLEAAEVVCATTEQESGEILDRLTGLVDKSLVAYEEQQGTARYRLLETIRHYATEHFLSSGDSATLGCKHKD